RYLPQPPGSLVRCAASSFPSITRSVATLKELSWSPTTLTDYEATTCELSTSSASLPAISASPMIRSYTVLLGLARSRW
ncbi:hypothetical protein ACFZBE_40835, partial [Streptomyces sp. NPDC008061]|uniref:hypothetical protein n=1 Tax=Streptomyces sp. NPDC008061 TaxID=3364805 RepID=UPI0036E1A20B